MATFGSSIVEEGFKCTECRRGTYRKICERHHGGGLAKAILRTRSNELGKNGTKFRK